MFLRNHFVLFLISFLFSSVVHSQELPPLDASIKKYEEKYEKSLAKNDTIGMIKMLINISDIYSHRVEYGKSYDGYWKALILAEKSNKEQLVSKIYESLGWLYGFYKRNDEAKKYFNLALSLNKERNKENEINSNILNNYFALTNLYRSDHQYEIAQKYLDSAFIAKSQFNRKANSYYLEVELGYLTAMQGDSKKGIAIIQNSYDYFNKVNPAYFIVINTLLGNIYKQQNDFNNAVLYYNKSLLLSHKLKRHLDYELLVYESLADIYQKQKKFNKAFYHLKKAKENNDLIFGGRSQNNKHLLEIKDKYRIEKDKQEDLIKQQRISELEHEESIALLRNILFVIVIVFILSYSYVFFRHMKNKHKTEKEILNEKQLLKLQQKNEILEMRNNELTQSALRIIEKDDLIQSLKSTLSEKGDVNIDSIKKILKTAEGTPEGNWKEFEARFTLTHQSFYKNLKEKFPELTTADQRVCALIKLNFSSKHMAQLLNISVESIHSSRYRVRKKLGLQRTDNLEAFIHGI